MFYPDERFLRESNYNAFLIERDMNDQVEVEPTFYVRKEPKAKRLHPTVAAGLEFDRTAYHPA